MDAQYPKDFTKKYWKEICQTAKSDLRKEFGVKGDTMKLAWNFGCISLLILLGVGLFGISTANIFLKNPDMSVVRTVAYVLWFLFAADIIALFVTNFLMIPLTAYFSRRFQVAAKRDYYKQIEINDLTNKLNSDIVDANILFTPKPLYADTVSAILRVENRNVSKKISGCTAKLTRLFTKKGNGKLVEETSTISAIDSSFLYWQKNEGKEIDINYNDEEILFVATPEENKLLRLAILNHNYGCFVENVSDNKRTCEIRFKVILSGSIGNKEQVFYKTFCGKIVYEVNTDIEETGNITLMDEIDFVEISEADLEKD